MNIMTNSSFLSKYNQGTMTALLENIYLKTKPDSDYNMFLSKGFVDNKLIEEQPTSSESVEKMSIMLSEVCMNTQYIFHAIKIKVHYIVDSIIYSINTENVLSLSRSIRSLLEHLCSLDYLITNGNKTLESIYNNHDNSEIEKRVKNYMNKYEKMFYNSWYFQLPFLEKKYGKQKKLNIFDLIDSSKKIFPNVRSYYDFLCEFTHPYFGSNLLTTTKSINNNHLDTTIREYYVSRLLETLSGLLEYYLIKENDFQAMLKLFGGYRDSAREGNSEVKDIFTIKQTKHSGDGSSKNNAIHFKIPRNGLEYAKTLIAYCKDKKIDTGKYERYESDGKIYFVYEKDSKKIWVVMPAF